MKKLFKTIINYFKDPETNIFKNYIDALLGMIMLIVLPALSLFFLFNTLNNVNLINYVFPLASICFGGAYDTYGRYEYKSPKNIKLCIRLIVNVFSVIIALVAIITKNKILIFLSPTILIILGLMLCFEVFNRVKTAIMISKWYAK